MSDRQKKEYLREDREPVEKHKEDKAFEDLKKKIGAKTIDCRNQVTPEMRFWFRRKFGYKADDCSILTKWEER